MIPREDAVLLVWLVSFFGVQRVSTPVIFPPVLSELGHAKPAFFQEEEPLEGGEEEQACRLDLKIYAPKAQVNPPRVIPENSEASHGAHTLVNNDIDAAGQALQARLQNADDLVRVKARHDLVVAPIAAENDLVRIDLHNPDHLNSVFLNAYAFALENGAKVKKRKATQSPLDGRTELRVWRNATKAGNPVNLPYAMVGRTETLYVEGMKSGRFRLALFHLKGLNQQKAGKVKATFSGNSLLFPAPGALSLNLVEGQGLSCKKTPLVCQDDVRLTVATVDIQQSSRKDVYDAFWGGRPHVVGKLWPRGGAYAWSQNAGMAGQWIDGRIHGVNASSQGAVAVDRQGGSIATVQAAFAHQLTAIGTVARGSASLYAERWILTYRVEGVILIRAEPVTLIVPQAATIGRQRNRAYPTPGSLLRGTNNSFNFGVRYRISDQHRRRMVGPGNTKAYRRQYGCEIAVYEALGPKVNASEQGDNLTHKFTSQHPHEPTKRARSYSFAITTAQRSRAFRKQELRTQGEFPDSFSFSLTNDRRNAVQLEIRENRLDANAILFDIAQDIVTLLDNGATTYDLLLASGNRLQVHAPDLGLQNVLGPIGFKFSLGAANGTQIATNNPRRMPTNHNP